MSIKVKAYDEHSGINRIAVQLQNEHGRLVSESNVKTIDDEGYHVYSFPITENTQSGRWELNYIYAYDNVGNNISYHNNSSDLSSATFEVYSHGEVPNTLSDIFVTSNETWNYRTVNSDVYVGPQAILTIKGDVRINGNIYVLGGMISYGTLNANKLYAREVIFGYTSTFYNGTINIRSGINNINAFYTSNQPIPDIPMRVLGPIVVDDQGYILYLKGEVLPIADFYINDIKADYSRIGTFTIKNQFYNAYSQIDLQMLDIFGKKHYEVIDLTSYSDLTRIGGIGLNGVYNSNRTITFNQGVAILNGEEVQSGFTISDEGVHDFVLNIPEFDPFQIQFEIDKTLPIITIEEYDTQETNQDITVIASTNEGSLNQTSYTFTENGEYTFIATDEAGNVTEETVTITNIDKTPPEVSGVVNNKSYNSNRTISFNEGVATLNEELFVSGSVVSEEGSYLFVATDSVGNKTTIIFTIDKTFPIITIEEYNTQQTNQDITVSVIANEGILNQTSHTFTENGSFTFIATDKAGNVTEETVTITNIDKIPPEVSGVVNNGVYNTNRVISFNEGTATLNGSNFTSGTVVSVEGSYVLEVSDVAGNKTKVEFKIDKTAPVVSGVENNGSYNANRTITFNEGTATLNGSNFTSGTVVSVEGSYVLEVSDVAGNKTKVEFKIDKTAPVVSGVENNGSYNTNRTITFNEGIATLNGSNFTSDTDVSVEGSYVLEVSDAAGNKTKVEFKIDKTAPVVSGVENNGSYNTNRTISFNEGTATLNGSNFTSGTVVSVEGSYVLEVSDVAGNKTKVEFKIDKTAPVVSGVENNGSYNTNRNITFNEGIATLNGLKITSGTVVSVEDQYVLVVADAAGNKTKVEFKIAKTPTYIIGDVNGDGRVSIADVVILRRYLAGLVSLTETEQKAADLNKDNRVSIADLVQLRRQLAGLQ